ncbi:hypothetical protein NDU88_007387 [Pleurodeles waltl]|uniref:Endonuclease/exonuclease/phosphatase domain-containing protein n=1 Tax=Pleurodeles waltl TaxID=8319 RepID=A0AAV7PLH4_PLEWA|nr:hypothetical protein NDU88_007387 [Pleurodeles waltl]
MISQSRGCPFLLPPALYAQCLHNDIGSRADAPYCYHLLGMLITVISKCYLPRGWPTWPLLAWGQVWAFHIGASNATLDPCIDRSGVGLGRGQLPTGLLKGMADLSLFDAWRHLHPQECDDMFYSNVHKTYSRIDYFLVSNILAPQLLNSVTGMKASSDHAPVCLDIGPDAPQPPLLRSWVTNEVVFRDPSLCDRIKDTVEHYFTENDGVDMSPETLWTRRRLFFTGKLISHMAAFERTAQLRRRELETYLAEAEAHHKCVGTAHTLKDS